MFEHLLAVHKSPAPIDSAKVEDTGEREAWQSAPVQSFPERNPSLENHEQGLFHKFDIRRVDGSDRLGGKHFGCRYFVIDMNHDAHASAALLAYSKSCAQSHPWLADDLKAEFESEYDAAPAANAPFAPSSVDRAIAEIDGHVFEDLVTVSQSESIMVIVDELKRLRAAPRLPNTTPSTGSEPWQVGDDTSSVQISRDGSTHKWGCKCEGCAPTTGSAPDAVAKIVRADEYGPIIEWSTHWVELLGAELFVIPPASPVASVLTDALRELENIVNAKRFDHEHFEDDTAYADWVQSRARACIALLAASMGGEPK